MGRGGADIHQNLNLLAFVESLSNHRHPGKDKTSNGALELRLDKNGEGLKHHIPDLKKQIYFGDMQDEEIFDNLLHFYDTFLDCHEKEGMFPYKLLNIMSLT